VILWGLSGAHSDRLGSLGAIVGPWDSLYARIAAVRVSKTLKTTPPPEFDREHSQPWTLRMIHSLRLARLRWCLQRTWA